MAKNEKLTEQLELYYDAMIDARQSLGETQDMILAILMGMRIGCKKDVISEQMIEIRSCAEKLNKAVDAWDEFVRISNED